MKDRDGMDLGTLIAFLLIAGAIIALIIAFVLMFAKVSESSASAYEKRMNAKREYEKAIIEAAHVSVVGDLAFIFTGYHQKTNEVLWDKFPVAKITDTGHEQIEEVQIDPRYTWLSELVKLTLITDGYGPHSTRLVTCNRAEQEHKLIGGVFADRTKWEEAVKYGIEIDLIMTSNQGTLIKSPYHAADLGHELLLKSPVLKAAIETLPTSPPTL